MFIIHNARLVILFYCFFLVPGLSQNIYWKSTNGPSGGRIKSIGVIDSTSLIAITSAGLFLSHDKGISWQKKNATIGSLPTEIVSCKNGNIFVCDLTSIYKSTDKGETWTGKNISDTTISNLSKDNKDHLFLTSGNNFYYSTNYGETWNNNSGSLPHYTIYDLSTASDSNYYLATSSGIYRSADNGITWLNVSPNINNYYQGILNLNGKIYVCSPTGIYSSNDSGKTWNVNKTVQPRDIIVDSTGNLYAYNTGLIFKSTDKGTTWTRIFYIDPLFGINSSLILSPEGIFYAGSYNGILKFNKDFTDYNRLFDGILETNCYSLITAKNGYVYTASNYNIFISKNGGSSWDTLDIRPFLKDGEWSHKLFIDKNDNLYLTFYGKYLISSDYGKTWETVNFKYEEYIEDLIFSNTGTVFAVTRENVYRSADKESWKSIINYPERLTTKITEHNGYLYYLNSGKIYFSDNNGDTWSRITPKDSPYILNFIVTGTGSIIGGISNGIYLSNNGGLNWSLFNLDTIKTISAIYFYEAKNGEIFAGTDQGAYSSKDNGYTWQKIIFENNENYFPWSFTTNKDGFVLFECAGKGIFISSEPVLKILPAAISAIPGDAQANILWSRNTSPDFNNYILFGASEPYANSVIYSSSNINDTSKTIKKLTNFSPYYLRIAAVDKYGNKSYSEEIILTPLKMPDSPLLAWPLNESINVLKIVQLKWRSSKGTATYALQLSSDSVFNSIIKSDSLLTDTIKAVSGLLSGNKYYWRVQAENSVGKGAFSDNWYFITLLEPPVNVTAKTFDVEKNKLTWLDNYTNESGFIIERRIASDTLYQMVDSLPANTNIFIDSTVSSGITYKYRIKAYTEFAVSDYSNEAEVTTITDVNSNDPVPTEYAIKQNYPNPFNPSTMIEYSLPYESNVKIVVYNSLGEVVAELADGVKSAGTYTVSFNAASLSSGIYFCSIKAESADGKSKFNSIKKMMLLK